MRLWPKPRWLLSGILLLLAACAGNNGSLGEAGAGAFAAPRFDGSEIDHVYDGEFNHFVGGGVTAFDCDDNRKPDLYLAGGTNPASIYRNVTQPGAEIELQELERPEVELTGVTGAFATDIDADGVTDLAILRLGENQIMRGLGDCHFERANEEWGIDGGDLWTVGFSAAWETDGSLPMLAFGNYIELDDRGQQFGGCSDHQLYRPEPRASSYPEPTTLSPGYCSLSMLFSDWSRSGQVDLRVSNDRQYYRDGEEQLWSLEANPRLYGRQDGWRQVNIWGMGIASQDLTGDGLPEVYLTSISDNKLQTLDIGADQSPDQPIYADIAFERGVTAHRPFVGEDQASSTAWHPIFEDVNNDGWFDLFVTKGNVDNADGSAREDPNNLLMGQADGSFIEAAEEAGLLDFARSRGAAVVDLNLDGLVDIVYINRREPARVWRNLGVDSEGANFLALQLHQPGSNRDAIGAWIEVQVDGRSVSREVTVGGGHAGGHLGWIHFGLGDRDDVQVRVQWPDGELGEWQDLDANQFVTIDRETNSAEPQSFDGGTFER